ncbi:hypothetical protein HKD37_02G005040 [Glycine soja]
MFWFHHESSSFIDWKSRGLVKNPCDHFFCIKERKAKNWFDLWHFEVAYSARWYCEEFRQLLPLSHELLPALHQFGTFMECNLLYSIM